MASRDRDGRQRGEIERRVTSLRAKVYAGVDPVTGKRVYRSETVKGTDEKAYKQAERKLTALMAEIDRQRSTPSVTTLGHVIDEWLRTVEIEDNAPGHPGPQHHHPRPGHLRQDHHTHRHPTPSLRTDRRPIPLSLN